MVAHERFELPFECREIREVILVGLLFSFKVIVAKL